MNATSCVDVCYHGFAILVVGWRRSDRAGYVSRYLDDWER